MGHRKKPIENLVRIPSEGSGPTFQDGTGNGYYTVRDKFMAFLRLMFPTVAIFEHKLPPCQRHYDAEHPVQYIPNVGNFYPIGIMAPYVQMTPEQQEAVNNLYLEIGRAIRDAYNEGMRNGQNLLVALAKGEVSLSDFDEGIRIVRPKDDWDAFVVEGESEKDEET